MKHSGHVGGLVIRRGKDVMFAILSDSDIGDPLVFGAESPVFSPGVYSVTLIADGPTSVNLPLRGSSTGFRLRPGRANKVARTSISAMPNSQVPLVYASTPVTVAKNSLLVVAAHIASTAQQAESDDLCLRPSNEPCPAAVVDGSGTGWSGQSSGGGSTGSGSSSTAMFFYPGDVRPGKYFAGVDQATVGLVQSARLVTFSIAF